MSTSSSNSSRGRRLATIGGILVSVALLLGWPVALDWTRSARRSPRDIFCPGCQREASYLSGHLLRGVRCRLLLPRAGLGFATAANVVITGYAVNNLLPARAGELARAALISQRSGLPFTESLTVTLVERLLDGLAIVGLFLVGAQLPALPQGWLSTSWGWSRCLPPARSAWRWWCPSRRLREGGPA